MNAFGDIKSDGKEAVWEEENSVRGVMEKIDVLRCALHEWEVVF